MTFKIIPELFKAVDNPLESLPTVSLKDRKKFPGVACIYFLCTLEGQVLYVGRTENLAQRWSSHHCYKRLRSDLISFDRVKIAWLEVYPEVANFMQLFNELEAKFIQWHRPPYNNGQKSEKDRSAKCTITIELSTFLCDRLVAASLVTGESEYRLFVMGLEEILRQIEEIVVPV